LKLSVFGIGPTATAQSILKQNQIVGTPSERLNAYFKKKITEIEDLRRIAKRKVPRMF
jgi:hypothetical protein